jgi:hypothetical protein
MSVLRYLKGEGGLKAIPRCIINNERDDGDAAKENVSSLGIGTIRTSLK